MSPATAENVARQLQRKETLLYDLNGYSQMTDITRDIGGGDGSRTRVRKCYWSRDYMLSPIPAPSLHWERSRTTLRTDKKRLPLACALSLPAQT